MLSAGAPQSETWMLSWEKLALLWINGHHHPLLDSIFVPISFMGEWGICWIALLAALFFLGGPEHKKVAMYLGLAMLVASVCVVLPLRFFFPRERPYGIFPEVRQLGIALTGNSFPSGHAQSAWLVAVVLGAHWRRFLLPLTLFALLVCYSRLYCGMHYPLDVIMGASIGISVGSLMLYIAPWLRHRAHQGMRQKRAPTNR